MVAEVFAGLSALKAAFDLTKGLKEINDAAIRNGAIIDLQEKIRDAQQTQSALVERVRDLEAQAARLKTWEVEKQRYQLAEVAPRQYAYVLRPEEKDCEPPHWICPRCYEHEEKSVLQGFKSATFGWSHNCPVCELKIIAGP